MGQLFEDCFRRVFEIWHCAAATLLGITLTFDGSKTAFDGPPDDPKRRIESSDFILFFLSLRGGQRVTNEIERALRRVRMQFLGVKKSSDAG